MKVETQVKQKIEKQETTLPKDNEENQILSEANMMPFCDILNQGLSENAETTNALSSINTDFNYDTLLMDIDDALFFINLANEGQFTVEQAQNGEFKNIMQLEVAQTEVTQKSVSVTNKLTELIEKAQNTQKPVRITFDNNVSVILKIDKHGKLTAEFIPGNIEVENYLKNNIALLKQRFDEQNLPYNDLLYRQNNRQNKNKNKRGEQ